MFFITCRLPLFHIIVMSLSWYDCPTFISCILSNTKSSYYLWWTVRENVIIASIDKFNKICCVTGKIISSADCLLDCNKDRQLLNLMTIPGRVNENHNFRWNLEQTPLQAEDPFQCKVHVYPFTMFSLWSVWFKQYVQQHKRTKHLAYSGFWNDLYHLLTYRYHKQRQSDLVMYKSCAFYPSVKNTNYLKRRLEFKWILWG